MLARPQWLRDRDDRGNYIAQKTYTEKRKQSCFFLNVGLKQTAGGTDPNITLYYSSEGNQRHGAEFVPLGLVCIAVFLSSAKSN